MQSAFTGKNPFQLSIQLIAPGSYRSAPVKRATRAIRNTMVVPISLGGLKFAPELIWGALVSGRSEPLRLIGIRNNIVSVKHPDNEPRPPFPENGLEVQYSAVDCPAVHLMSAQLAQGLSQLRIIGSGLEVQAVERKATGL
jgi:hypothetical protein